MWILHDPSKKGFKHIPFRVAASQVADVSHAIGRSPGAAVMLTSGGKAAWPFLTDGWSPDPSPLGAWCFSAVFFPMEDMIKVSWNDHEHP